jgi:hypothetical protein
MRQATFTMVLANSAYDFFIISFPIDALSISQNVRSLADFYTWRVGVSYNDLITV